MDRTSILGDTIDYMKELLERIHNLQEEKEVSSDHLNLMGVFKDGKPNEVLVRNAPKVCEILNLKKILDFTPCSFTKISF